MLLTITTTYKPASELGFLLHKNPGQAQSFDLSFGRAHVFYPCADEHKCTAAMLLDVDPISLVRGRKGSNSEGALEQYVNDRPYVASSLMSVAIAEVFGTALSGRCKNRPELVNTPIPLEAKLGSIHCRSGERLIRQLFEPLGYEVTCLRHELDGAFPSWGLSHHYTLTIRKETTLRELLSHVYVLLPVLDDHKHYFVGDAEVEKLLRHGEGWLSQHPACAEISRRYLRNRQSLIQQVFDRLTEGDESNPDEKADAQQTEEEQIEDKISLNQHRITTVVNTLKELGVHRVIDLGCGNGKLLRALFDDKQFEQIVGLDVSHRALESAHQRLKVERMSEFQKQRLQLIQGSLTYKDARMSGFDAATMIEVIEHLDASRLSALERVLFKFARPKTIVITTPNIEYNANFETLPAGQLRHKDHRFEWTRAEFQGWANTQAQAYGYSVQFAGIGDEHAELGAPTQMGVFSL